MVLTATYPASLDALANPNSTTKANDVGFELDEVVARAQDIMEALEAKLGVGASTPGALQALLATSAGLTKWDTFARPNLLANGWAGVWDQGTTPLPTPTDNLYFTTPWRLLLEAASAAAITQETTDLPTDGSPYAFKLTVGSGEDNKFGIWQPLPYARTKGLRNKQVSIQLKMKATAAITDVRMAVMEWVSTADSITADPVSAWNAVTVIPTLIANWSFLGTPANLNPTTAWDTYRVEGLTIGASANNLAVMVWCEDESTTVTTDILRITDIKLEEGAFCTAYGDRDLAREQDDAAWLYEEIGGSQALETMGEGMAISATAGLIGLRWSRPKRTIPGITFSAVTDFATYNATGSGVAWTGITADSIGNRSARLLPTGASGLVAGNAVILIANSTTNARIRVSARL